jgi:hypothetical protein
MVWNSNFISGYETGNHEECLLDVILHSEIITNIYPKCHIPSFKIIWLKKFKITKVIQNTKITTDLWQAKQVFFSAKCRIYMPEGYLTQMYTKMLQIHFKTFVHIYMGQGGVLL